MKSLSLTSTVSRPFIAKAQLIGKHMCWIPLGDVRNLRLVAALTCEDEENSLFGVGGGRQGRSSLRW